MVQLHNRYYILVRRRWKLMETLHFDSPIELKKLSTVRKNRTTTYIPPSLPAFSRRVGKGVRAIKLSKKVMQKGRVGRRKEAAIKWILKTASNVAMVTRARHGGHWRNSTTADFLLGSFQRFQFRSLGTGFGHFDQWIFQLKLSRVLYLM